MKSRIYNILLILTLALSSVATVNAQTDSQRSRRSSLCSILVKHSEDEFADHIEKQFLQIETDDKFNDHNLAVRVATVDYTNVDDSEIHDFVNRNKIASRLVARWFNRNKLTGSCNLNLVKSRGLYDASALDHELASRSVLGKAMLEDAGEDLIGHTYLLMHEITYIDKGQRSSFWGALAGAAITMGAVYAGLDQNTSKDLGTLGNLTVSSLKGFKVKVRSRLYRLVWDTETSDRFFATHYWSEGMPGNGNAFDAERDKYRVEYIGDVISKGNSTSFLGINEDRPDLMIRKACARAMEENVAALQKKYEQFRIKTPVNTVSPTLTAKVGLKEGVSADSRFEVLECQMKDGKTVYKRVGVVKPIPNMIWDNRFMASEEGSASSSLGATTFKVESGSNFYEGMLLREL